VTFTWHGPYGKGAMEQHKAQLRAEAEERAAASRPAVVVVPDEPAEEAITIAPPKPRRKRTPERTVKRRPYRQPPEGENS
jgi:hypothetical protein